MLVLARPGRITDLQEKTTILEDSLNKSDQLVQQKDIIIDKLEGQVNTLKLAETRSQEKATIYKQQVEGLTKNVQTSNQQIETLNNQVHSMQSRLD